ncbi:MAG: alpha-2-macroglobulin family protein [Bacteroidetes bacterium]|nr:MAG: alpha-2-macroglobulin family protein [Bacteroidota bacterium]
MFSNKLFFALIFVLFFANSCNIGKDAVSVSNRNFAEQIELRQNLVFTFNNDLAKDSLLDQWKDDPYISFSPAVKGKFKWKSANELVFSPDAGFSPSTNYKATLSEPLAKLAGKPLAEDKNFDFHTPYLNLKNSDIYWAMNSQGTPEVRMSLNFNYPVNPADVNKLAKVMVGTKELPYKVISTAAGESVQIAVVQEAGEQLDQQAIKIQIANGLQTPNSNYLASPIQFEIEVPSKDDFRVLQATAEYEENNRGFIHVYTNQGVGANEETIKKSLQIEPNIAYEIEKLDYGFLLKGEFGQGSFKIKIDKNLKGIFGTSPQGDFEQLIVFGAIQPTVAFASQKAAYLTSKGAKNIGLRIANMPKIAVTIYKIYRNNIIHYLGANTYMSDEYENYYDNFASYGDVVYDQILETKDLKKADGVYLLNMDFPDTKPFQGFYMVKVSSSEERWVNQSKMVSVSDIGFIVKETPNDMIVFVNSIMTAQPLKDVELTLVSSNNQDVYNLKTDEKGIAKFSDIQKKAPNFNVKMIAATQGNDFNFLYLDHNQVNTSRYEVGGLRDNASGYQAFIYAERDLYRPDETMKLKTIVRNKQWQTVGEIPVKVKVILPNGREFLTQKGTLSAQGTLDTSIKLPASTVTGSYEIAIYTSNDVLLNSKYINVEEFVPHRIKVTPTLNKETINSGEKITLTAQALNLFGPPAADRNYEVELSLQKKTFYPEKLNEYNFSMQGRNDLTFENELRNERKTDSEGKIEEDFEISSQFKHIGMLEGKIYTTVFDESGRSVTRMVGFDVLTQLLFYGIKSFDEYVTSRQATNIGLIAVNEKSQIATSAKARVQIIQYEWQNVLENNYGTYRYVSQKRENILEDKIITISGRNSYFPFTPRMSGTYEVRVSSPDAEGTYVSQQFYAYQYGSTQTTSFEVDKEGEIQIETNKSNYEVGETAKVLFKTPFSGKMLVTIERDKIFEHFYVQTDKKSASIDIPIKKEYLPNFYVSATLIKPLDDSAIPLTVAHGFQNMTVENKSQHQINLTVNAVENSRSKRKQDITIKSSLKESNIEMTVSVVDEGILSIRNSPNPEPYDFFFQKRALEVNAYDLYPRLFPELKGLQRNFGSDGYDLGKRTNPLANKRIKPVSFWSGTLKTNSNGEAKFTVDIPQFSGDLRIVAVAVKDEKFGTTVSNMKVADPMVISTALPRFLSPSDEISVPVTITNTTDKPANAVAVIQVNGKALNLQGNSQESVTVPANSEKQVMFRLSAKEMIGEDKVTVEVQALGEKFVNETEITIRPSTSLLKTSASGMIKGGNLQNIDLKADYISSSIDAKLFVSKSPVVEFAKNLNYLVNYPYGCVEQTISTAFPQLYFAELSENLGSKTAETSTANFNVQEAIRKLQTMQIYNGGLTYWQGGDIDNWWGSVYAGHFALEARKAGFSVDQAFMTNIYNYLAFKVRQKETSPYVYNDARGNKITTLIAPKEMFYSLYVLALAGKQELATMNYYKANLKLLSLDSRYLLAVTYLLVGDKTAYNALLPAKFEGEKSVNSSSGSFYSYIRDQAISLSALVDSDPQNAQIPEMARSLSMQLKQSQYLNTQESAFALLALGKLAKKNVNSDVTASLTVDGKKLADLSGISLKFTQEVAGKKVDIQTKGSGNLYYFWELEGLNTSGKFVAEDRYLKVRREFFDRNGNRISGLNFKQNDLLVIKISLESDRSVGEVQNVVVTDMLPAGLEVENPRIGVVVGMDWIKNPATPQYVDFRDDRVNIFATASPKTQEFYYVVRAVSKGKFRLGAVSADAMYDGSMRSYSGAGTLIVQ